MVSISLTETAKSRIHRILGAMRVYGFPPVHGPLSWGMSTRWATTKCCTLRVGEVALQIFSIVGCALLKPSGCCCKRPQYGIRHVLADSFRDPSHRFRSRGKYLSGKPNNDRRRCSTWIYRHVECCQPKPSRNCPIYSCLIECVFTPLGFRQAIKLVFFDLFSSSYELHFKLDRLCTACTCQRPTWYFGNRNQPRWQALRERATKQLHLFR